MRASSWGRTRTACASWSRASSRVRRAVLCEVSVLGFAGAGQGRHRRGVLMPCVLLMCESHERHDGDGSIRQVHVCW
jgi:hypothetical protein